MMLSPGKSSTRNQPLWRVSLQNLLPVTKAHAEGEALINCAVNTGRFYVRLSPNKLHFSSQPTFTHWARDSLCWLFFGCPLTRSSFRYVPSNESLRPVGR